jgi:glycosyltransferase involved in cell wall biosynthesis
MKIMHVGWGYTPFRGGGLIDYAEDLMEIQSKMGWDVFYFCTGKSSIFLTRPTIKKWTNKRGYEVYEFRNPPIIAGVELGVANPFLDINEPVTERVFFEVLESVKPDLVHFHELTGLPSVIIKQLRQLNIKTVFTIHDYYTLCPILKLVKTDGEKCTIRDSQLQYECAKCCIDAPKNNAFFRLKMTFRDFVSDNTRKQLMRLLKPIRSKKSNIPVSHTKVLPDIRNYGFYERRLKNLEHLNYFSKIIAVSNRVSSIFNYYKTFPEIQVIHGTVKHIDSIDGKVITLTKGEKIRFGLINVLGTNTLKGKKIILDLFAEINTADIAERVQFVVLGNRTPEDEAIIANYPFVDYYGKYKSKDLNAILNSLNIHVGIVPSVWEEAYGFVGIEFLAKGIPVIGNNIGGIPEYVVDGKTGWLNNSCTSSELLSIITKIVNNPTLISELNASILKNRSTYIKDMKHHFDEVSVVYSELLNKKEKEVKTISTGIDS